MPRLGQFTARLLHGVGVKIPAISLVTEYYYPLTNTSSDPTSSNWKTFYIPAGYRFVPNDGIYSTAPLRLAAQMFSGNTTFNDPDITTWDMSTVEATSSMFQGATSFNQPIGVWDTSRLAYTFNMFNGATSFNQNLSSWCMGYITAEQSGFSTGSALTTENKPVWGSSVGYVADGTITYVGVSSGVNSATLPAHQAGDIIFAWTIADGNNGGFNFVNAPSGWISIVTAGWTNSSSRFAYKIAQSSSEVSGTWTDTTSVAFVIYRGDFQMPANSSTAGQSLSRVTSTTITYPAQGIWPSNLAWTIAFAFHASTDTALESPPSGLTLRNSNSDATDEIAVFDSNGLTGAWPSTDVSVGGTSGDSHVVMFRLPVRVRRA